MFVAGSRPPPGTSKRGIFEGIRFHGAWATSVRQEAEQAPRTLRNMRSVWVKEFEAVVENDKVTQFRVNVKLSFLLDEGASAG